MKHFYTLLFFCSLGFQQLNAQINYEEQSVQVNPQWHVGDRFNYQFTDVDYVISINDTVSKVVTNSHKKFSVLDENPYVYKLRWENLAVSTNDPDPFYNDYMLNSKGINYDFATNKDGEFLELLNEDGVKNQLLTVAKNLKRKNRRDATYQGNVSGLEDMIRSQDYVSYTFSQEINNLLQFNGLYLKVGEKYQGKQIQENLFGFPISSTSTTWLEGIDPKTETYTIVTSQILSKEDFESLWQLMAKSMLEQSNVNLTHEQVEREIKKYSDTIELTIDYKNKYNKDSVLINSHYKFSLNIGTRKTVNQLEIELL